MKAYRNRLMVPGGEEGKRNQEREAIRSNGLGR